MHAEPDPPYPTDSLCVLETVGRLLGRRERDRLWRRWSGRTLCVPKSAGPGHPLAETLGIVGARLVCDAVGGVRFNLPLAPGFGPEGRRHLVRVLSLAGVAVGEIATKAGCTERNVARIRSDLRAEGALPRLPARL